MTDTALSSETMLAGLQDIRLPPDAAGGPLAELAVTAGLGLLAALAASALLRALTVRRTPQRPQPLDARIAALRPLPDDRRRVALLHLLREAAPDRHGAIRDRLYQPGGMTTAEIEAEVTRRA
jgi:hypothetical protein